MRIRALAIGLVAIGVIGFAALPASAATELVVVDGVHHSDGDITSITGVIVCDEGERFTLRVNVQDSDGDKAIGKATGRCTGGRQGWQTLSVKSEGVFSCSNEDLVAHGKVGYRNVQGGFQFHDDPDLSDCDTGD